MPVYRRCREGNTPLMQQNQWAGRDANSHDGRTHASNSAKQLYFTIDCDWVPGSQTGLEALLACCDRYHVKATVFFAGRFAEAYPDLVRECHRRGHQLGTHGWAHGGLEQDEDFRTAGLEQQRQWIRRATEAVQQAAGIRPVIFRAPNLWIGETTLRVLEEEGYLYDSSVPARRFDFGFGRVHYLKYFWAPSQPYRPSELDLSASGASTITEVPPSACLFPINLATLRVLGLSVLGRMIHWIVRDSRHLVFYCHPSEFVHARQQQFPRAMSKWNRWGMCPENVSLVEELLDYLFCRDFVPAHIMHATVPQLDLRQPVVLRAGGF
ncbi:MAG TPA: polysaccharide deacetylase family protein [Nitrospira sp.]